MTGNEKLAEWQGWEDIYESEYYYLVGHPSGSRDAIKLPDYLNDDAAAMSLLDTLVEKGYEPKLQYYHNIKQWGMMPNEDCGYEWLDDTRREAVVAACLELIEKENTDDPTR